MLKQIAIAGGALIVVGSVGVGVMAATGHTAGIPISINGSSSISIISHNLTGHAVHKQQLVDTEKVKSLSIRADIAAIRLVPTTAHQATVKLSGSTTLPDKDLKLTSNVTGSTLQITLKDPTRTGIGSNVNVNLDIAIPEQTYDSLDIHTSVGSVSVNKVDAKQMTVHVNTGKVELQDLESDVTATSNVGAVNVINVAGPLHLTANTGSVKVQEQTLIHNIDASTNTGTVSIASTEKPKHLSFDLTTSLGDVTVQLPGVQFVQESKRHVQGTIGQGGPNIHASSNLGSVTLM